MDNRIWGADAKVVLGLNYICPIIGIVLIITDPQTSVNNRFHVLQSIFLWLATGILSAITCGVGAILSLYPLVVAILMFCGIEHRVPGIAVLCDRLLKR